MVKERMKANQISPLNSPNQNSPCVCLSVCDVLSLCVYVLRVDVSVWKIGPLYLPITAVSESFSLYRIKAQIQTHGYVFLYEPQVGATNLA